MNPLAEIPSLPRRLAAAILMLHLPFLATPALATDERPCYQDEGSVAERTRIIWCRIKGGGKLYFRAKFFASPNQCKVSACEKQAVEKKGKPVNKNYAVTDAADCAAALAKPGCFALT